MTWFSGAGIDDLQVRGGEVTVFAAGSGRTFLAYFGTDEKGETAVPLLVGDKLQIRFDFIMAGEPVDDTNSFRIGCFDSRGGVSQFTRVFEDGFGNGNPIFKGYTGIAFMLNPGAAEDALRLYQRTTVGSEKLLNASSVYTSVTRNDVITSLAPSTQYTAEINMTRQSEDVVEVSLDITGGELLEGDYAVRQTLRDANLSGLDTLAFNTTSGQRLDYRFTNFVIEHHRQLSE
jgi:hypothetical protein